ncbi:aminotransferase class I/II-fold pyridoxal phosphate-dependent enzyme [Bauldia sp.]|uniref:aminotransferase class I/II-fold pyridoxal phosphate-dependent enzyme n=1 Tax=Bauldia sp. TaxID=2575872 RepID=UPI003BAC04B2
MTPVSKRVQAADDAFRAIADFYDALAEKRRDGDDVCDFTFGNPNEMPLPPLVDAIRQRAIPQDERWYAYKSSDEESRAFVAERLSRELSLSFEPEDIVFTAGAFVAISIAMRLVLDAGDEALFSEPAWFCYEPMLLAADAVPKKVALKPGTFDLDFGAIDAAITPKTRLVIVNSPHNPTGRIYDADTLRALADLLDRASERIGRRIFLLSDEPYRRLRFDGRDFVSPASIYPWTLISYSYGKVLLAPGQRLGYLAVSPLMPRSEREPLRDAYFSTAMALGWVFASALMQYTVPDLEDVSVDIAALTRRRDVMFAALTEAGYEMLMPEGTFYLFGRWPRGAKDPWRALADRGVYVLAGATMNVPDYFRICLTATDDMVARALPVFREIAQSA